MEKLSSISKKQAAKVTDPPNAAYPSYIGWSAFFYRASNDPSRDINKGLVYVLNGTGDGWFRATEGNGKGYGLALVSIKVTSRNPVRWENDSSVYKCIVKHIDSNTEEEVTDNMWLYVSDELGLDEVLSHIKKNSSSWRP